MLRLDARLRLNLRRCWVVDYIDLYYVYVYVDLRLIAVYCAPTLIPHICPAYVPALDRILRVADPTLLFPFGWTLDYTVAVDLLRSGTVTVPDLVPRCWLLRCCGCCYIVALRLLLHLAGLTAITSTFTFLAGCYVLPVDSG